MKTNNKKYSHMIKGCKLVEIPYLESNLETQNENIFYY